MTHTKRRCASLCRPVLKTAPEVTKRALLAITHCDQVQGTGCRCLRGRCPRRNDPSAKAPPLVARVSSGTFAFYFEPIDSGAKEVVAIGFRAPRQHAGIFQMINGNVLTALLVLLLLLLLLQPLLSNCHHHFCHDHHCQHHRPSPLPATPTTTVAAAAATTNNKTTTFCRCLFHTLPLP